jgi:DNA-binding phage protein
MLTLDQVKAGLHNYKLKRVAEEAGVCRHALYRMMKENAKPSYETVKKLSDWLGRD